MENTEKKVKAPDYKWFRDKKMIGTIILITSIIMMIFAFVKVPGVSTINAYTVGMLMGFYSPLFYMFVIYLSLIMIFGDKIKLPSWVRLTPIAYWVVVISILFISASTGFYQSKNGFTTFGGSTFGSFNDWYDTFTDNETMSAWTPVNTNGGVIGVFLYAFTAMATTGIGSLIIAITMLVFTVSLLASGSFIGLYRDIHKKRKMGLRDSEIKDKKDTNIGQFEEEVSSHEIKQEVEEQPKEEEKSNSLPFDDPF